MKEIKAKVDPRKAGLEVLSIRRTGKEEDLLVLKKGGDVSASRKELDRAVGERAEISALVSTIRDLDETVEKEEVVYALCFSNIRHPKRARSNVRFLRFDHGFARLRLI